MVAQFKYRDVAEIMGSWPFADVPGPTPNPQLQANSLQTRATLIGTVRETTDGYLLGGLSLNIYVDVGGVPTLHAVTFPAGTGSGLTTDHFTLAEVIARFQASTPALPANTAQNADNFLILQSQTLGENSYIRLESISGAEGVFQILGMIPGLVMTGGDIAQTQTIDPTRQLSGHGQLSMAHGETFRNDVVNRGLMQVAVNSARNAGTLDLRRIGIRQSESFVGSGAASVQLNTGAATQGVYTGPVTTPTEDQLSDYFVVLDANGNEFTQEYQDVLQGPVGDLNFTVDADTQQQRLNSVLFTFAATDVDNNVHVVVTNFAVATALNNVPLKIIGFIDSSNVVVEAIDPSDGSVVQITESTRSGSRVQIYNVRAEIDGIYQDVGLTTRAEQQSVAVTGGAGTITRIEAGNRVYVPTATFTTDTQPGDLAVIAGAAPTSPFSNNGTYRVKSVIDDTRIELVNQDYSPVILNPDAGGGLGTVTVSSDGDFWRQPFARFAQPSPGNLAAGRGAVPQTGDNFQIVYLVEQSMRGALDSSPAALVGTLRYEQESNSAVKRALMRLAGPSVTAFDDILHSSFDISLEKLDARMDREHYETDGRHSDIRPDTIDMFPGVTGPTVTVRGNSGADAIGTPKIALIDDLTGNTTLSINHAGQLQIGTNVNTIDLYDQLDVTGAQARGDLVVEKTGRSLELLLGSDSHYVAAGTASTGFARAYGAAGYRWYLDNGVQAQPSIFYAGLHQNGNTNPWLSFDLSNNSVGVSAAGCLVIGPDGNVGIGMGNAASPTPIPAAPLHVRSRSGSGDVELVRITGDGILDPTVAMTFQPRTDQAFFSFIEVDHDNPGGAGDWYMNYALTSDMDTDSDGANGVGSFRWVAGATTGGGGNEIARMNSLAGLLLGTGFIGSAANAALPRLSYAWRNTLGESTRLMDIPPGATSDFPGASVWRSTINNYMMLLQNAAFDGDIAGANSFTTDTAGSAFNQAILETLAQGGFAIRSRDSGGASPFQYSDFELDVSLTVPGKIGTPANEGPTELFLRNGTIEIGGGNLNTAGAQPNATTAIDINKIYATSFAKAWALLYVNAGAVSVAAAGGGLGISSVAILGTGIDVNWQNAFDSADEYIVSCQMERSTSVVGATVYSNTQLSAKTASDCTVQPVREGGFAIDCANAGQDFHILLLVYGRQS